MDDIKAKQQIVEKIKTSTNILVTVSNNPSVDALSAAIGTTLLLDKLNKHATAVFSGTIPPALAFLEPEKVLDDTTDSLRDFIIALDKEKADHLRYKIEGDSVKIFITPYKTTITSEDLEFSQGDYNVELVIALGVDNPDHLDKAMESHGQILHDATVITVTAGEQTSTLGGIDWHDDQASSLSEMVTGLSEALKDDKTKSLLDAQTATAFLTGIVAQTDRFSNQHTTSKVMTMASQLMAAGADQQLIATKLQEESQSVVADTPAKPAEELDTGSLKISKDALDGSSVNIQHQPTETLEEMDKRVKAAHQSEAAKAANSALDHTSNSVASGPYAYTDDPVAPEEPTPAPEPKPAQAPQDETQKISDAKIAAPANQQSEPGFGGVLNATTEQAAETARHDLESDQNKTTLAHSYLQGGSSNPAPMNGNGPASNAYVVGDSSSGAPTPADLGLPMPPPLPGAPAGGQATATGPYAFDPSPQQQPERLGDILAPEQPAAPATPAPTPAPTPPPTPALAPESPQQPPASNDPGQFKIPGQQ